MAYILPIIDFEKKGLNCHGSGAVQHRWTPPNDSGHPPPPLPCVFLGKPMIILKEKHKKVSNVELAMIVMGLFLGLAILFLPLN
jgi:hypothetical protein